MRTNLSGTLWRLGLFVALCAVGAFALVTIFAQLRFDHQTTYNAVFATVDGLQEDQFVRIAGVEVGRVKKLVVRDDSTVNVEFSTDDSVALTAGTHAVIRYDNLIGGRYLALEQGAGGTTRLVGSLAAPVPGSSVTPVDSLVPLTSASKAVCPWLEMVCPEAVGLMVALMVIVTCPVKAGSEPFQVTVLVPTVATAVPEVALAETRVSVAGRTSVHRTTS